MVGAATVVPSMAARTELSIRSKVARASAPVEILMGDVDEDVNPYSGRVIHKRANVAKPEMMADAAQVILTRPARQCTGNFFIDEEVLRTAGVTDFSSYAISPGHPLTEDLFLPEGRYQGLN